MQNSSLSRCRSPHLYNNTLFFVSLSHTQFFPFNHSILLLFENYVYNQNYRFSFTFIHWFFCFIYINRIQCFDFRFRKRSFVSFHFHFFFAFRVRFCSVQCLCTNYITQSLFCCCYYLNYFMKIVII